MTYKSQIKLILASGLTAFSAILIYVLFRNGIPFFGEQILSGRFNYNKNTIPAFIKYNLPDALWLISLILILQFIFYRNSKTIKTVITVFVLVTFILLEILQRFQIIAGTFDWLDIISYLIIALISLLILKSNIYEKIN